MTILLFALLEPSVGSALIAIAIDVGMFCGFVAGLLTNEEGRW